jgi:hypothetical protein
MVEIVYSFWPGQPVLECAACLALGHSFDRQAVILALARDAPPVDGRPHCRQAGDLQLATEGGACSVSESAITS